MRQKKNSAWLEAFREVRGPDVSSQPQKSNTFFVFLRTENLLRLKSNNSIFFSLLKVFFLGGGMLI